MEIGVIENFRIKKERGSKADKTTSKMSGFMSVSTVLMIQRSLFLWWFFLSE